MKTVSEHFRRLEVVRAFKTKAFNRGVNYRNCPLGEGKSSSMILKTDAAELKKLQEWANEAHPFK